MWNKSYLQLKAPYHDPAAFNLNNLYIFGSLILGSLSNHDDKGSKKVTSFIFGHFADVLVPSTTCNDIFCSCVYDVSV